MTKLEWFYITVCTITSCAILFWGTSEPIYHQQELPSQLKSNFSNTHIDIIVLGVMFLHWAFVPYSIYCISCLSVAISSQNLQKKFSFSYPSEFFYKKLKFFRCLTFLDVVFVFTLFIAMSSSLCLGIKMISSVLSQIFQLKNNFLLNFFVMMLLVFLFVASSISGLLRGILVLSRVNSYAFLALMLFLFIFGPSKSIVNNFLNGSFFYLKNFLNLTVFSSSFFSIIWLQKWSFLHWGSWLSWAPMTGIFLARLTRGYTVKEVIEIQVFLPSLITCLFLSILCTSSLFFHKILEPNMFKIILTHGPQGALFYLFSHIPMFQVVKWVLLILLVLSFVTAADSNLEAISSMCLDENSSSQWTAPFLKIFWGLSLGIVSLFINKFKDIEGLRLANHISSFPSLFLLLVFAFGLLRFSFLSRANQRPISKD